MKREKKTTEKVQKLISEETFWLLPTWFVPKGKQGDDDSAAGICNSMVQTHFNHRLKCRDTQFAVRHERHQ